METFKITTDETLRAYHRKNIFFVNEAVFGC